MATMTIPDITGDPQVVEKPLAPGRADEAAARPIVLSAQDFARLAEILAAIVGERDVNVAKVAGVAVSTGDAPVNVKPTLTATGGVTPTTIRSVAGTNATIVHAGATKLVSLPLFNIGATRCFFKLFNLAVAPTVGSSVPVWNIPLPPGEGFPSVLPEWGFDFSTGFAYAITGGEPSTDSTAVAAGQVVGVAGWMG